ncbi:MAG: ankyrin repeat domain-containing protein [Collimonas sp.]|uniref:ankyrin repeat domain-containing protein n=1 Tax=Collimonas sp. TaxID=1963772 RepID=UPI0032636DBE
MRHTYNRIFFSALICGALLIAGCQSSGERATAFLQLCKFGQADDIEAALKKSDKVDIAGEDGVTGLMVAAAQDRADVVKLLLAAGADVKKQSRQGPTALMLAVGRGSSVELANMLLAAGSDVNAKDIAGNTPLMLAAGDARELAEDYTLIFDLKEQKDTEQRDTAGTNVAQEILKEANRQRRENGFSSLMVGDDVISKAPGLGKKNNAELLSLLLEKGANINSKNTKGDTAFIMAANWRQISIIGQTKIGHQATVTGLHELVKAKADANISNNEGETALMAAAMNGDPSVLHAVINANTNLNAQDAQGFTALMLIAAQPDGNGDALNVLIKSGADVHLKDSNGDTALILASMRGNLDATRALIKAGSRIADKNMQGLSALGISRRGDIRKLLVEAGGDTKEQAHWMAQSDLNACIKEVSDRLSSLRFMQNLGAPSPGYISPDNDCPGFGTLSTSSRIQDDLSIKLNDGSAVVEYYGVKLRCSIADNRAVCQE